MRGGHKQPLVKLCRISERLTQKDHQLEKRDSAHCSGERKEPGGCGSRQGFRWVSDKLSLEGGLGARETKQISTTSTSLWPCRLHLLYLQDAVMSWVFLSTVEPGSRASEDGL